MKSKRLLQNLVIHVYPCTIFLIMLICIFFNKIKYATKGVIFFPPLLLILLGSIFFFGIYSMTNYFNLKQRKKYILIFSIILFIMQLLFVYNYYFYTDWDVEILMRFSDLYAHNQNISDYRWYFSIYPNNLFLAWIFSAIRFLAHKMGLHAHEYFVILSFQCFLNAATGYLLFCIIEKLFGDTLFSGFGYTIYVLLVGISPWVSIPYSDSMALIFPCIYILVYIYKANSFIMWFFIGICSAIGYKIKPQTFIMLIAIVLVETFDDIKRTELKKKLLNDLIIISGIVIGLYIIKSIVSTIPLAIDKNMSFGMAHFFMMGMNPVDMGVWSENDVIFSGTFATCAERNVANLHEAWNRIKDMQMIGVFKQLVRKTLTNYYNGTFSWGAEGVFFFEIFDPKNTPICDFLRSLYYTGKYADIGKYYVLWSNYEQMIWMTILFLNIFTWHVPKNKYFCTIMLSILGLTIFELLFEARARYLYIYAPLYIILAVYGFRQCIILRGNHLEKYSDMIENNQEKS
nr:hypothetical protein [Clostridium sp. Marseille-P7770]